MLWVAEQAELGLGQYGRCTKNLQNLSLERVFSHLNPCRQFQNTLADWLWSLFCSQQKVCRYFCFPAFEEGLWHYAKSSDGSIPKTPPKENNPGQSSADPFLHWDFSNLALHTLDFCMRTQICSPLWISYSFSFWCGVNSAAA